MPDQQSIGQILIISGLPASGKGVLARRIIDLKTHNKVITYCTRELRDNEKEGIHYYRREKDEFKRLVKSGEIIEHDMSGRSYKGTGKGELEKLLDGQNLLWEITATRAAFAEEFFLEHFGPEKGQKIIERMIKVFVMVHDHSILLPRYIERESKPNIDEFQIRLAKELEVYNQNQDRFVNLIYNDNGSIEPAVEKTLELARQKLHSRRERR